MDTAFEIKGYWWLPETPEHQISGVLTFSPGESILLELMGTLNDLANHVLTQRDFINPEIILGVSVDGKPITLQKCTQISGSAGMTGISISGFSPSFVYDGVHFSNGEQSKFRELSIGFLNLDEWFSKSAFSTKSQNSTSLIVTYEQPRPIKTTVEDYHFDFAVFGPNSSQDHFTHVHVSQNARINIGSDTEKSIDEFQPYVRHIQNFLTLAISKPTFITKITGFTESAKEEGTDTFYYPVNIFYHATSWKPTSVKVSYFEMIFRLPDVEEQLEKILTSWISKAEIIKPVYDLYFSALYNPSIYQEFQFLSLAQAIETYHRQIYKGKYQPDEIFMDGTYKDLVAAIPTDISSDFRSSLKDGKLRYANEYSLRKRIHLLGEHLTEQINISFMADKKLRGIFAEKVTDTRNYFTHYSPELKDKAAKSGQELRDLIHKLRFILQICFLEELGFSFDKIRELFRKRREYKDYLA